MTVTATATHSYSLGEGEKATPLMAYTLQTIVWGHVVTREALRVSTWLRTQMAPEYACIWDAQVLVAGGQQGTRPQSFKQLFLPVSTILAYHIMPPASEPLDYDPDEPSRKEEPASALAGNFRFDGLLRMSTHTSLERFLDVSQESFISMYTAAISQPGAAASGVLRVPLVLLRREMVAFSAR